MRAAKVFVCAAAACATLGTNAARASSHREAPFVTTIPKADGADFYMFNSYEAGRAGFVTLIADYIPVEEPGAAPNFYMLDPDVTYDIHVDNDGSATAGVTFSFRFANNQKGAQIPVGGKMVDIPLINFGQIKKGDASKLNVQELYNLTVFRGANARAGAQAVTNASTGSAVFEKPVDNIGAKSIPDYETYARAHIYDVKIPGCDAGNGRVFVGQRKDPFVVNLAEIFDLVNLNPLGAMDQGKEKDALRNANITSFVLEVPSKCLAGSNKVIGGWTTASMPRSRVGAQTFLPKGQQTGAPDDLVQVSRLGMPLVNELVIGLKDKDKFNSSEPKDDAQFAGYVTNPTLPALLELLFGDKGVKAPTAFPRADLVTVFLKGIPGVNANGSTAEMLRLNVTTPPTPAASQSNLGVLGKDNAGFPNGRRPGDDVVDIELRVAMGVLLPAAAAPSGQLPFTDGAVTDASHYDATFPYLKPPLGGSPAPLQTPAPGK